MDKKVLINQIFAMVCTVVENKDTPYNVGVKLLEKALHNDTSYLDELPNTVSDVFIEIHQDIFYIINLLTEKERKMISENLYKELYLMLQNIDKTCNTSLSYVERARGKYNATLKQIIVNVLIAYIGDGISLKSQYESFKIDYEEYAKVHMGPISKIADSSKRSSINECIMRRIEAAKILKEKYKDLKLSNYDLRTPLEDDLMRIDNSSPIKKEEFMFNINTAV